jgi:hypothetical protein
MEEINVNAESLTRNLEHQKLHGTALRNLAYSVVVAEHRGPSARCENIALALFYRALQTHEAMHILIREMLVEDAEALVRVLVEQIVNCAYMITVADDQTADDFIKYPKFWRYKILKDLVATNENRARRSVSIEMEEEIRLEHESLRLRFKDRRNGEWCVDGQLHVRAARVDEKLSQVLNRPSFEYRWMVNSEWRFASSHVHSMADSLLDQVTMAEGTIVIEQKYVEEDASTALYSANFALSLPLPLVDNLLGEKRASEISAQLKAFTGNS